MGKGQTVEAEPAQPAPVPPPGPSAILYALSGTAGAGIASMAFGLAVNFLVPLQVTKAEYADIRFIFLVTSYAGLFHLGVVDGLYLEAIGRPISSLPRELIRKVELLAVVFPVIAGAIAVPLIDSADAPSASVAMASAVAVSGLNLASVQNQRSLAGEKFGLYARSSLFTYIAAGLILAVAAVLNSLSLLWVVGGYAGSTFAVALIQRKRLSTIARSEEPAPDGSGGRRSVIGLWRRGRNLLLANLALTAAFSVDRLIVAGAFSKTTFADYAMASGIAQLSYLFFDGAASALAPLMARGLHDQESRTAQRVMTAAVVLSPLSFWAGSLVILTAFPAYDSAIPYLLAFVVPLPAISLLRIHAVAAVRAGGLESQFRRVCILAALGVGASCAIGYFVSRSPFGVAMAWSISLGLASLAGYSSVIRTQQRFVPRRLAVMAVWAGLVLATLASLPAPVGLTAYLALVVAPAGLSLVRTRPPAEAGGP